MPGLLALGAVGGAADEYLKQSEETRKNRYQEIRDRRLAEIGKESDIHRAELATTENIRQEGVAAEAAKSGQDFKALESEKDRKAKSKSAKDERDYKAKNYSYGPDETVIRDGEVAHKGEGRKTSGTGTGNLPEAGYRMLGSGKQETMEGLRKIWATENTTTDEFGNKMINPEGETFFRWMNKVVVPEDQIDLSDPTSLPRDPDLIFDAMRESIKDFDEKRAIERIQREFPGWPGPYGDQSAPPQEPVSQAPAPSPAPAPAPAPAPQTAGLLTQGAQAQPASGNISVQAGNEEMITGPIKRKIRALEQELARLPQGNRPGMKAKRDVIIRQIDEHKRLLGNAP